MASYFEEMGWEPLQEGQAPNHFLHLARLMQDMNMFEELGIDKNLPPPASAAAIASLPDVTIQKSSVQCPICLKEFDTGLQVKEMPCKHIFHSECILPWLSKTNSCPLCRYELPTDNETYELYKAEQIRAKEREKDLENLHNSMFS
ncbi:E3 ubiquitin-protein ligase RNF181-like [Atheta coriaria]|uniref:E3 ubiquitin-protein ligase RNF181-like n=1 Tax=Dalotia coriaria TaxID=877792 RepID=UPI0031F34614